MEISNKFKFSHLKKFVILPAILQLIYSEVSTGSQTPGCIISIFPNLNLNWESSELKRGTYRYSNPSNIVITSLRETTHHQDYKNQINDTVKQFSEILVASKSIFIFFSKKVVKWKLDFKLTIFPALKIIVSLPQNCTESQVFVQILCGGYCSSAPKPLKTFQKSLQNVHDFHSLHHKLFWKPYRKLIIPTLPTDYFYALKKKPSERKKLCLQFKRISYICRNDIIMLYVFRQIHNITVRFHRKIQQNFVKYHVGEYHSNIEYITPLTSVKDFPLNLSSVGHLAFDKFDSDTIHYCLRNNEFETSNAFNLAAWLNPFTLEIWIAFIIIGRGLIKKTYNLIVLSSLGFLLSLYGNGLTSIVTIMLEPKGYESLNEFLENNYKLIVPIEQTKIWWATKEAYKEDFKRLGLESYFCKAFYTVETIKRDNDVLIKVAEKRGIKLGILKSTSMSTYFKSLAAKVLRIKTRNPSLVCLTLEERLREQLFFWDIKTENQYWLQVTLQRVFASGLYYKWEEWSTWSRLLNKNLLKVNDKLSPTSDYIQMEKFRYMLYIWWGLILVSLLAFCNEIVISMKFYKFCLGVIHACKKVCQHFTANRIETHRNVKRIAFNGLFEIMQTCLQKLMQICVRVLLNLSNKNFPLFI
ncbi:unnamed protein product [Orchesella dallaii]|uniref:Uncharacterized protein n=1 Tax=Orchesella dallaii TaxID=48710 RepID=A0ABP1RDH5_9HEXA